jgi:hypothetical protein
MAKLSRNPVTHLRATINGFDTFGFVWSLDDEKETKMFSMGSATGPVDPIYTIVGELKPGTPLYLAFDYTLDDGTILETFAYLEKNEKTVSGVSGDQIFEVAVVGPGGDYSWGWFVAQEDALAEVNRLNRMFSTTNSDIRSMNRRDAAKRAKKAAKK